MASLMGKKIELLENERDLRKLLKKKYNFTQQSNLF